MSIISTLIFKEKNRNEVMQSEYLKELKSLPKGTIKIKKVNGNEYYYLTYRDGEKIVTKYVGKDKDTLFKIDMVANNMSFGYGMCFITGGIKVVTVAKRPF